MRVIAGDCLEQMRAMEPNSVDAIVCDPPYGLEFMGKDWDKLGAVVEVASEGADASHPFRDGSRRVRYGKSAASMQEWHRLWAVEALRVIKPGGHMVAFGGSRTFHRLACAIEDAGWEIRDTLSWLYGSGFPKSLDVSKALDKAAGAEREVVGQKTGLCLPSGPDTHRGFGRGCHTSPETALDITAPATDAAKQWAGWGTALKPAHEPIILARKPLSGTVAQTVTQWGTGAINVDACRIAHDGRGIWGNHGQNPENHKTEPGSNGTTMGAGWHSPGSTRHDAGRWPANVVLSHAPECREVGTRKVKGDRPHDRGERHGAVYGNGKGPEGPAGVRGHGCADGTETVPAWECAPGCPVAMLDAQSGERKSGKPSSGASRKPRTGREQYNDMAQSHVGVDNYGDAGGASRFFATFKGDADGEVSAGRGADSPRNVDLPPNLLAGERFFYTAKASRREREAGLEGMPESVRHTLTGDTRPSRVDGERRNDHQPAAPSRNVHPTVKPLALMRWLCRLVTPPGGVILDPFCGSGSTGCAAVLEGFDFVGIEMEPEYVAIAERRLAYWGRVAARYHRLLRHKAEHPPERKAAPVDPSQLALFGAA